MIAVLAGARPGKQAAARAILKYVGYSATRYHIFRGMETETAQVLALKALAYIATDEHRIEDFQTITGADEAAIRAGAADPRFLGGLLDYVLEREGLMLDFCRSAGIRPDQPAKARAKLPGAPEATD